MPLNDSRRDPTRERWPLQFDLEGIPRDNATRKRLLEELRAGPTAQEMENTMHEIPKVKNTFAGDTGDSGGTESLLDGFTPAQKERLLRALIADVEKNNQGAREFDLSKPPVAPYSFKEFPKSMYSPDGKHVVIVHNREQEERYTKQKYTLKPPKAKTEDEPAA